MFNLLMLWNIHVPVNCMDNGVIYYKVKHGNTTETNKAVQ